MVMPLGLLGRNRAGQVGALGTREVTRHGALSQVSAVGTSDSVPGSQQQQLVLAEYLQCTAPALST